MNTPAPPSAARPFRHALQGVLNLADEPVVTPPVYGSRQAARATVPAAGTGPAWLRELNLDPAARAAAGLGARIVQERQEELMAAAWRQLGDVHAVARLEHRLELGVAVLGSIVRRHVEPLDPGRLLQLLGPAHTRMRTSPHDAAHAARDPGPAAVVQLTRVPARAAADRPARAPPRPGAAAAADRGPRRHAGGGDRARGRARSGSSATRRWAS